MTFSQLYRTSKIACCFAFLALIQALFVPLSAQQQRVQKRPYADYRQYHLGFHVGVHTQDLTIHNSGRYPDRFAFPYVQYAEVGQYNPGFSVGVISNYSPSINVALRLSPTLHFGERSVSFSDQEGHNEVLNIRSNILELPFAVKLSATRLNNIRPYFTTGAYTSFQLGQKEKEILAFRSVDAGVLFSVGCDFYLDYFKLSPELKFTFGIPDILQHERPQMAEDTTIRYTYLLDRVFSRMIMLTFNFE